MTRLALLFEGALGAIAFSIGWLVGHWPAVGMVGDGTWAGEEARAAVWGLAATVPMLAVLLLIDRFPIGPLARLREIAHGLIREMFQGASALQLAAVSAMAGLGEELLFRGLLQEGLSQLIGGINGPWIALAAASALFGVCHWLNTTYGVLAILAGVYFGVLLMATGSLWTPIVAHAAYDFFALTYLVQPKRLLRSTV
jgi:membrane protease YdiL (CAAX protease family)